MCEKRVAVNTEKNVVPPVADARHHGCASHVWSRQSNETTEGAGRCRAAEAGPGGHAHQRGPRDVAGEEAQYVRKCLHTHVHSSHCPKHVKSESLPVCVPVRIGESLSIIQ